MNLEALDLTVGQKFPLQLDRVRLSPERSIHIVRDDLLPAGTKQRAILPLLSSFQRQGTTHMIYASPFAGFAQVALAYGCHALGLHCTLFCEKDPHQPGIAAHAFSKLAQRWGAKVVLTSSLSEAEELANELAISRGGMKMPLGFHCFEFQQHFQAAISEALENIRRVLGCLPNRTWLPVGSGTFTNAFHKAAPHTMELLCVDVHVLDPEDLRLQAVHRLPGVRYFSAKETFMEMARQRPPVPSNAHYDAKLWSLVESHAQDGDLWWNVAR